MLALTGTVFTTGVSVTGAISLASSSLPRGAPTGAFPNPPKGRPPGRPRGGRGAGAGRSGDVRSSVVALRSSVDLVFQCNYVTLKKKKPSVHKEVKKICPLMPRRLNTQARGVRGSPTSTHFRRWPMMLDSCGAYRSSRGVTPFRLHVHVPYMPRHIRLLAALVPGSVLKGVVCHFTTMAVSASLALP